MRTLPLGDDRPHERHRPNRHDRRQHTGEDRGDKGFRDKARVRSGVAMNVVRIRPVRCSPVIVNADSIISTGTPNIATPMAARSGGSGEGA